MSVVNAEAVVIVLALPDGSCGAFTSAAVSEARARAQNLGFGRECAAPTAVQPEKLVSSKQLADLTGANDTLLEQMARDRRIPSVRIGRLLRFEPARVMAALRAQTDS